MKDILITDSFNTWENDNIFFLWECLNLMQNSTLTLFSTNDKEHAQETLSIIQMLDSSTFGWQNIFQVYSYSDVKNILNHKQIEVKTKTYPEEKL